MVNTPLDMRRKGVILEQAYGGPSSVPGKAALLTGRYSSRFSLQTYHILLLLPIFKVKIPLVMISYRTGLPLVSPATLEPMGLPTDFKLLPKVEC